MNDLKNISMIAYLFVIFQEPLADRVELLQGGRLANQLEGGARVGARAARRRVLRRVPRREAI